MFLLYFFASSSKAPKKVETPQSAFSINNYDSKPKPLRAKLDLSKIQHNYNDGGGSDGDDDDDDDDDKSLTSTLSSFSSKSSSSIPPLSQSSTSSSISTTSSSSSSSKLPVKPKPQSQQLYLDFGQRSFGKRRTCHLCQMMITQGDEDDEKRHKKFCRKYVQGVELSG